MFIIEPLARACVPNLYLPFSSMVFWNEALIQWEKLGHSVRYIPPT